MDAFEFAKRIVNSASKFGEYVEDLAGDLSEVIKQVKTGQVKVNMEHKGLEPAMDTLQRVSKQLVAAILSGSLIIGSCLIIVAGIPPRWHEVPVFGIIGLVLATIIAIGMLRSISGSGRDFR